MPLPAGTSSGGLGAAQRPICGAKTDRCIANRLRGGKFVFGEASTVVRPRQLWLGWPQHLQHHHDQQPFRAAATVRMSAAAPFAAPLPLEVAPSTQRQQQLEQQQDGSDEDQRAPAPWAPPIGRPGLYDKEGRLVLKSLTLSELEAWCAAEGEVAPANRALQLWRWMYADPPAGSWVRRLEDTVGRQNGFSAKFIDKVGPRVTLDGALQLSQVVRASDGTRKLVFRLTEGEAAGGSVETVLIPIVRQQGLRDRLTICVSSQVGCAMNCQFCYTGRMGLLGNLTTAQIVEQVVEARRFLALEGDRTQLTNLVFMGMGEPLHNTEAVLAASEIVSHYLGLHISHNKITISTVGLIPEMRKVLARTRVQMALSLHATTDEVRDWIVPVNRRYDLPSLTAALEELFPKPQPVVRQPEVRQPAGNRADGAAAQQQQQQQRQVEAPSRVSERCQSHLPLDLQHPQHPPRPQHEQRQQQGSDAAASGTIAGPSGPIATTASAATAERDIGATQTAHEARPSSSSSSPSSAPTSLSQQPSAATGSRWLPPLGAESADTPSRPEVSGGGAAAADPDSHSGTTVHTAATCWSPSTAASASAAVTPSAPSSVEPTTGADAAAAAPATAGSDAATAATSATATTAAAAAGRSLLVEYTMLHGINDTAEDAQRLADMLSRVHCKVNLIVFNPHAGTRFQPSRPEDVSAFRSSLVQRGLVCTIRDSRGDDEMAACGQLGNVGLEFRPSPILEAPERFRSFLLPPTPTPAAAAGAGAAAGAASCP